MKRIIIILAAVALTMSCSKLPSGDTSGIKAVDLGLSVKWADVNIGAKTPEAIGDYFAWGVTETYYTSVDPYTWKPDGKEGDETVVISWKEGFEAAGYFWSTYKWCTEDRTPTKYTGKDGKTVLDANDDAAAVKLGDGWRMPTREEMDELITKCDCIWTERNGVHGLEVRSKAAGNNNSIFLPAGGGVWKTGNGIVDVQGLYWTSSFPNDKGTTAYRLLFSSSECNVTSGKNRPNGFPIRAVKK